MPPGAQRTPDRPSHNAPENAEVSRHAGGRADPKFGLPTELPEQFHLAFPVHKRHPDPIGMTVRSRTGGGPKLASTPGPKFDSIATLSTTRSGPSHPQPNRSRWAASVRSASQLGAGTTGPEFATGLPARPH